MRLFVAALVLALSACASATFRPHVGTDDPIPGAFPSPEEAVSSDIPTRSTARLGVRQACRAGTIPRGWIAVAYLEVGRDCPRREGDDGYNGVLLERFEHRPIGTVLVICADQPTPSDWIRASIHHEQLCEGARVEPGEPSSRAIQRVR